MKVTREFLSNFVNMTCAIEVVENPDEWDENTITLVFTKLTDEFVDMTGLKKEV